MIGCIIWDGEEDTTRVHTDSRKSENSQMNKDEWESERAALSAAALCCAADITRAASRQRQLLRDD